MEVGGKGTSSSEKLLGKTRRACRRPQGSLQTGIFPQRRNGEVSGASRDSQYPPPSTIPGMELCGDWGACVRRPEF